MLTAELAVAYVEGLQAERVAACIKHFVGNDTEFERMTISSEIDERTLRELYLVPFEAAVRRAGVQAVMTGYNRLNGTFCGEHPWLLTDVLRGEWGFDGVVVSDWFGTHSAAASLLAGLDLEMPGPPLERGAHLLDAVRAGEVDEHDLDRAVARLLALAEWTGAADDRHGGGHGRRPGDPGDHPAGRHPGHGAAEERGEPLPLASTARRVALIGPYARYGRPQGGGSARVQPDHGRGPLEALQARRLRRHVRAGRVDRQVPADGARRLHRRVPRRRRRQRLRVDQPAGVVLGQAARRRRRRQPVLGAASPARSCPIGPATGRSASAPSAR